MESIKLLRERRDGRILMGRRISAVSAAALLALAAVSASGQATTGNVFGSVADKSGAVIPGATVTIADTEHGVTRTVQTNGSGEFTISSLPVGTYILTVDVANFSTAVITDIKVDANANVKEPIELQAGSKGETVQVEDTSGSAIDARSATIGTLIDQKLIEDLPIDGHNVVALSALLPGVVDVNAPATFTGDTGGPTYSASGSRNTQNLMLFDGLFWNNLFYNTGVNFPTPNALQEVSVLLNNYKAQYGRNAGSVFSVLTKRGTNTIHGAVWDYLQNQYFNAHDYITKANPKDDQNQFGFTVGGPIIKDKLFYFGAYQQLIGRLQTTATAIVPGYAERGLNPDGKTPRPCAPNGPFPGMTCASFLSDVTTITNGVSTPGKFINPIDVTGSSNPQANADTVISVYNNTYAQATGSTAQSPCLALLNTAQAFAASNIYAGTKIQPTYAPFAELPTQCLNPVILNVLNTYVPYNGAVSGNDVTTSPAPTGDKNGLIRLDYILSPSQSIDARYNVFASDADAPTGVNSMSQGIATYGLTNSHARTNYGNVHYQWAISPTLLNQVTAGYKRFETYQFPDDNRTLNNFGGNFNEPGIPTLPQIGFGGNYFTLGSTNEGYQDHINENVQMDEALIYTKGNHTIQGGYTFLRLQYLTRADYPGNLSFSTTYTGNSLADGLTGLLNNISAQNRLIQGGIQHDDFFYLQDDWRATSKLTLNLGVRYEVPFQWFEPHGHAATFIPGIQSTVFPNAPGGLAFPGDKTVLPSLVPTDFNGIVPRLGFAYDVTGQGKLLIRGGFGMFSDAVNANVIGVGQPFHYQFSHLTPPGGASVPLATYGVDANGTPNGSVLNIPATYDPNHPLFIAPYSLFFPDPHFRTPYVEAVNLGFQYHIPHGGVLETNYVAKFARKLTIPVDLNPAIYDCTGGYAQAAYSTYCGVPQPGTNLPGNATSTVTSTQARLRYAPFNYGGQGIVDLESIGTSNYNALQMQYTQRGGRYLTILSSYTYSKSLDIQTNAQTTANSVPNVFHTNSDYGPSDNDARHNVTLGWVTRFPKVVGFDAPVRAVLNNWVYSGQYLAHTGRPFSVTINNDSALDDEPGQRAYIIPGSKVKLPSNRHRADKVADYFNRDAFSYPQLGTFSNQGRNSFYGPGYIMTNMTLGRDFPLTHLREGMRLNFRGEAFNVFNTPNLNNPNGSFSCSSTAISTFYAPGVPCGSSIVPASNGIGTATQSSPGTYGGLVNGVSTFAQVRSTFGNNGNTSTNGRKMQFSLTLFF